MYDLIIIGTGPAGLTAAIYAIRYRLNVLVIGQEIGGLMNQASKVDNYPGFYNISGIELMNKLKEHCDYLKIKIIQDEVKDIKKDKEFIVTTNKESYEAKSLILALGTQRRKLNIPGEDKFLGKGVSYCAICDAPLFKDKIVGVVGGNDSAATSALLLSKYAKKVYIIYRKAEIRAEPINTELVKKNKKIEIIPNTNIIEIKGNKFIEKVIFDNNKEFKLDGLFIEAGTVPSLSLINKLKIKANDSNYIVVNEKQETNIKGVFAAGDITTGGNNLRQMITACSEGAIAASSAYKYIKEKNGSA